MVCDLGLVDFDLFCLCVSGFVACDRNYDWGQRKPHLILKAAFEPQSLCVFEDDSTFSCQKRCLFQPEKL